MPGATMTYANVVPHMSHTIQVTQPGSTAAPLYTQTTGYAPHDTELELAVAMLNSIGDSINDDLQGLEQEVVTSVEVLDDIYIRDIK